MAKYLVFKEDVYVGNTLSTYSKHIRPGEKFLVTCETDYTYTFKRFGQKLAVGKSSDSKMYSIVVDDEAETTADKTWQDKNKFVCVSTPTSEKTWQDEFERLNKEKAVGIQPTATAKTWWDAVEKPDTTADKDIMPRAAWNETRMNDLRTAIRCALDAGREIPAEWVYELNDLLSDLTKG